MLDDAYGYRVANHNERYPSSTRYAGNLNNPLVILMADAESGVTPSDRCGLDGEEGDKLSNPTTIPATPLIA